MPSTFKKIKPRIRKIRFINNYSFIFLKAQIFAGHLLSYGLVILLSGGLTPWRGYQPELSLKKLITKRLKVFSKPSVFFPTRKIPFLHICTICVGQKREQWRSVFGRCSTDSFSTFVLKLSYNSPSGNS